MNRFNAFALGLLLCAHAFPAEQPSLPLAIAHITIVDTLRGTVQPDSTVVIRQNKIERVGTDAPPADALIVDGSGKFLIPGLWDMHVHLGYTTSSALPLFVANGITTVRDMGGSLAELDAWRTKIGAGLLTGPRILRVGPMLNGQKFNPYQMVPGNPDETRGVARALKEVGVDFIKIHRRLPRDSFFALLDEAKRLGIAVVGHIPMTVTPEEASDAGQVTIEHTETLFEGMFSTGLKEGELPAAIRRFRSGDADRLFARFVRNHTAVTPTLAPFRSLIDASDPGSTPDPRMRYVAASMRKAFQQPPVSLAELHNMKEQFVEYCEVVRQMNRDGVTLLAGTDSAGPRVPAFSLHHELALLVDCGLTPLQALQAATLTPATVTGHDDFGTVAGGKTADLVILDANPLQDIHNTERIAAVILDGKLLRRSDLDSLLRQAEELAKRN
ncbi:MAG TPA: amidohydrolase family protein [Thermoanaerobaculia bacterium]|nr:amidohydrolase family protein [Thermoanaerobaculia bacterium]